MIVNMKKRGLVQPTKEITPSTEDDILVTPDNGYRSMHSVLVKKAEGGSGGLKYTLTDGILKIL